MYFTRVLLGLDEFANTLFGGLPYDTISYRAAIARNSGKRWGCILCKVLDLFQAKHCDTTIEAFDARIEQDAKDLAAGKQPL